MNGRRRTTRRHVYTPPCHQLIQSRQKRIPKKDSDWDWLMIDSMIDWVIHSIHSIHLIFYSTVKVEAGLLILWRQEKRQRILTLRYTVMLRCVHVWLLFKHRAAIDQPRPSRPIRTKRSCHSQTIRISHPVAMPFGEFVIWIWNM